jgi:hypothetical protein
MAKKINLLYDLCKKLDTDYAEHGGRISRDLDPDYDYYDCSCGCKFFIPLHNETYKGPDFDFGVCSNPKSKRCGLLTFEHQAGYGCFVHDEYK